MQAFKMTPKILFLVSFCIILFEINIEAFGSNLGKSNTDHQKILQRTKKIEECFFNEMNRQARNLPGLKMEMSSFTKIFISEQLSSQLVEKLQNPNKPIPLLSLSTEDFCFKYLVKPYLARYPRAVMQRSKRSIGNLAPLGSSPIEAESIFVELEHNLLGRHNRGHSDITRAAIEVVRSEDEFSDLATEVIVRASQGPDLWKWKDEIYHAHTSWYEQNDPHDRKIKIEKGIQDFVLRFSGIIETLKEYAEGGASDRALFLLGVSSHLVQDLVYHRGMTLQQHAGLFMISHNPDFPKGEFKEKRWEEARALTRDVIRLVKKVLSNYAWENMKKWAPIKRFDLLNLGNEIFNHKQDIGPIELAEYVFLAADYLDGGRDPDELKGFPVCLVDIGIPCWKPNEVWEQILRNLKVND